MGLDDPWRVQLLGEVDGVDDGLRGRLGGLDTRLQKTAAVIKFLSYARRHMLRVGPWYYLLPMIWMEDVCLWVAWLWFYIFVLLVERSTGPARLMSTGF